MVFTPAWNRPPPAPPRPQPPPPPLPAGLVDEFAEREWGSRGEMLAAPPAPTTTVQTGLVIEPPPWAGHMAAPTPPQMDPFGERPGPGLSAHEAMMAGALGLGEVEEPPAVGPAVQWNPLLPPPIPAPDWGNT